MDYLCELTNKREEGGGKHGSTYSHELMKWLTDTPRSLSRLPSNSTVYADFKHTHRLSVLPEGEVFFRFLTSQTFVV